MDLLVAVSCSIYRNLGISLVFLSVSRTEKVLHVPLPTPPTPCTKWVAFWFGYFFRKVLGCLGTLASQEFSPTKLRHHQEPEDDGGHASLQAGTASIKLFTWRRLCKSDIYYLMIPLFIHCLCFKSDFLRRSQPHPHMPWSQISSLSLQPCLLLASKPASSSSFKRRLSGATVVRRRLIDAAMNSSARLRSAWRSKGVEREMPSWTWEVKSEIRRSSKKTHFT